MGLSKRVSATIAIRDYCAKDAEPVLAPEMRAFRKACSSEEWQRYGADAAAALGCRLRPAKGTGEN